MTSARGRVCVASLHILLLHIETLLICVNCCHIFAPSFQAPRFLIACKPCVASILIQIFFTFISMRIPFLLHFFFFLLPIYPPPSTSIYPRSCHTRRRARAHNAPRHGPHAHAAGMRCFLFLGQKCLLVIYHVLSPSLSML